MPSVSFSTFKIGFFRARATSHLSYVLGVNTVESFLKQWGLRVGRYVSSFPALVGMFWGMFHAVFQRVPSRIESFLAKALICDPFYCLSSLPYLQPSSRFLIYFPNKLFACSPSFRVCFGMSPNWDITLDSRILCDKVQKLSYGPRHLDPIFPSSFIPDR